MTDDELALRRHLDEELNRLQPRPVPTEAVYGRARAIRHTRRVWAAGALAVAAVLGTSLPVLGSMGLRHSAAGGPGVTVNAPHVDSKGRYVFSGSAAGKRWTVTAPPGECPSGVDSTVVCAGSPGPDPADFSFTASAGSPTVYTVFFGAKTTRVDMAFSDGEEVVLLPGVLSGRQVAMVEVPPQLGIARVEAYAADGSPLAYSIPFQANGMAHFATWYQPGQTPTQAEASGTITGTTQSGTYASVEVRIGPFGVCYTVAQPPAAGSVPTTNCRRLSASESDGVPPRAFEWVALGGQVDNRVDHVDFALNTGTIHVKAVRIGGYSFAVGFTNYGFEALGRTEYDASGHAISTGQTSAKP
ncbi:hypothetical protein ABH926_003474 [Catenulispora sp. GP43]|uniref:hypothetical protein n=1 Tax=Catenulispora sp. GP43 TaxID=3156263 RepID=UPI003513CDB1